MTPPHHHLLISALMLLASAGAVTAQETLPMQSPAAFAAALHDAASQFVAVTVVNDITGQTISGCLPANLLLGAMHREYHLGYDPDSRDRVLAAAQVASGRTFHFRSDEAWASMPANAWSERACQIIASGQVARVATGPAVTSTR